MATSTSAETPTNSCSFLQSFKFVFLQKKIQSEAEPLVDTLLGSTETTVVVVVVVVVVAVVVVF